MKRSAMAPPAPTPASGIAAVAAAPTRALTPNTTCAGTRSARLVAALASAPTTKPSCTLAVSQALPDEVSSHSSASSPATAEAENHSAIASTWARTMNARARRGWVTRRKALA